MRQEGSPNFSYDPIQLEQVLTRINIPRGQVTLFKALYEAGDDFVPRKQLIEEIRWGDPKSFTGVLAALAGRVNHTKGFEEDKPGYEALIEVVLAYDFCNTLWLKTQNNCSMRLLRAILDEDLKNFM